MNIVIYNTNSFGGNYEYSKSLADAYLKNNTVESCIVVVPENKNGDNQPYFKKILIPDLSSYKNKLLKKFYFLYRSIVNPLKFYSYLKGYPKSTVIFNDYDQLTSVIWVPFFKKLKSKHLYCVILHDANRDMYMPTVALSEYSMNRVMSIMDIAFYHEYLPHKKYYDNSVVKVKVPHGLYRHDTFDEQFYKALNNFKGEDKVISILGNIRDEKNYSVIISALANLKDVKLLVAGSVAHSDVPIDEYKNLINKLNLKEQVMWVQKFLTDDEFQSAIMCSDVILLYYKEGFTSQSGVLNLIAPHKKSVIVSNVPSALRATVDQFKIGTIADLSVGALTDAINSSLHNNNLTIVKAWDDYIAYADWSNHVDIAMLSFKHFREIN